MRRKEAAMAVIAASKEGRRNMDKADKINWAREGDQTQPMDKEKWLHAVLKEVHFMPDRKKIRRELQEHIEDRMDEYMDAAMDGAMDHTMDAAIGVSDGSREAAYQRAMGLALEGMGEPTALGKELNRQHKPWLGWLWLGTNVLVVIAVVVLIAALLFGWREQNQEPRLGEMDMVAEYAQQARYYDTGYNHSGDVLYSWQPDWKTTLLETEITFGTIAYDSYDGRLVLLFTSCGPYSFDNNCLDVMCSGQSPSMSTHQIGLNEDGDRVGVYKVIFERFDPDLEWLEISYDKFGERFSFRLNSKTGEVA